MTEMTVVIKKLELIDEKLDDLLEWKAVHTIQHEAIGRDINEVRVEIFGNPGSGNPGLKSKVQTLEFCKEEVKGFKNFWAYILQAVIISGILSVVFWLLNLR